MRRRELLASLRSEQGFTLIEMLVTISMGVVVLFALFVIQATTLHQTTRLFSDVDATQHARVGVEQLENELHSTCVADNVTPILTGSTSSMLMFVSQYGTSAALTPVEHIVTFNPGAGPGGSPGTITDATYAETGVTENANDQPVYTFASSPTSTRTVLTNVSQTPNPAGGYWPVFQYFAYAQPTNLATGQGYTAPDGNPYMMLIDGTNEVPGTSYVPKAAPLSTPLSAANAADAAEVMLTMTVGPSGGTGENTHLSDVNDAVQDGVVLRMTPAANEESNGTVFLPCQ